MRRVPILLAPLTISSAERSFEANGLPTFNSRRLQCHEDVHPRYGLDNESCVPGTFTTSGGIE